MPRLSHKWTELFLAFDNARLRARTMQQRESRRSFHQVLLFLLALSIFGFLCLLLR